MAIILSGQTNDITVNGVSVATEDEAVLKVNNETIAGVKTFSSSPIVPTPTTTGNVITMDNIIQKTPVGIGYGTGSGGTVTQLTSKSTTVTLNKPNGLIILNNAALAANAAIGFGLNNSLISANDHVNTEIFDGTGGLGINYNCWTAWAGNGSTVIIIKNISNSTLSDTISIRFKIIKGAVA